MVGRSLTSGNQTSRWEKTGGIIESLTLSLPRWKSGKTDQVQVPPLSGEERNLIYQAPGRRWKLQLGDHVHGTLIPRCPAFWWFMRGGHTVGEEFNDPDHGKPHLSVGRTLFYVMPHHSDSQFTPTRTFL